MENVLTRAAVLSQGDLLLEEHLVESRPSRSPPSVPALADSFPAAAPGGPLPTLDEVERAHIERVYALCKQHKGKTCQVLGISRPTLERKLRKYGLAPADEEAID